jgi:hypothetical protein
MTLRSRVCTGAAIALAAFSFCLRANAQDGHEADPSPALSAALAAACRSNEMQFANYLTTENAAAFRALPQEQRTALLARFSLSDEPGKPLLSTDAQNHTVLRCVAPQGTSEFRFGDARVHESLAFIPVDAVDSQQTEFGLVKENGGWRLLSLGLVLINVSQLSRQWAEGDLSAREDAAIQTLRDLGDAIETYKRAYDKLPESLAQLGPAPKGEISDEQASLINKEVAAGDSVGYRFRYRIVPGTQEGDTAFELVAMPDAYGKSGKRSFLLDSAGKVHGADRHGELASSGDPIVP